MRKLLLLLLLMLLLPPAAKAERFVSAGSMSVPRLGPAVAPLSGGEVLLAGGSTGYKGASLTAEIFSPDTLSWRRTGSMSVARFAPASAALPDGRVVVLGGAPGSSFVWRPLPSGEVYDPESGSWSMLSSSVLARRGGRISLLPDGKFLVWGGIAPNGFEPANEILDPATLSLSQASLPAFSVRGGANLFADPPLQTGGWTLRGPTATTRIYSDGLWKNSDRLHVPRGDAAGVLLAPGRVLVAGGWGRRGALRSSEVWQGGTWRRSGRLLRARVAGSAAPLPGGRAIIIGGSRPGKRSLRSSNIYRGRWRAGPVMKKARLRPIVRDLPGGRVLVAGGRDGRRLLRSAEVFIP